MAILNIEIGVFEIPENGAIRPCDHSQQLQVKYVEEERSIKAKIYYFFQDIESFERCEMFL